MEDNPNKIEVPSQVTGPDSPDAPVQDATAQPEGDESGGERLYAGKFKSPEEMEKAYAELQKMLGDRAPAEEDDNEPKPDDSDKPPFIVEEKSEEKRTWEKETYGPALAQLFDAAKLDAKAIADAYGQSGEFPEEAYAALEAQGVSRSVVDNYLKGVSDKNTESQVIAEAQVKEVKGLAGGDEGYGKMMQWASVNLSDAEKDRYDKVMASGDLDAIKMTVAGLKARYDAAFGIDPKLVGGRSKGSPGKDVFRSTQEVVAAMRDPRYGTDPAYTQEVEKKVARSDVFQSTRS